MAIVWPLSLPQKPLRDGFNQTFSPNVIKTDFEIGPKQTRPRSTFQGKKFTVSYMITGDQKIVFENFYQYTTLSGTQPFTIPDFYLDNAELTVKFDPDVRPQIVYLGGVNFRLSFGLDLQP